MSRRRSKTAVHQMVEGEVLVRGTTDPTDALRLVLEDDVPWSWEEVLEGLEPDYHECEHVHRTEEELEAWKREAAEFFARRLDPANHRVGWFRINPVGPDHPEGWTWQLGYCDGPGPGNFQAVYFH